MEGAYWLLLSALVSGVVGQLTNWQEGQVNTSICLWRQPRAAIVRDIVYLDGGSIWWAAGLDTGEIVTSVNNGNFDGKIFRYNLSMPFNTTTNVTGILTDNTMSKSLGGEGNSNGAAPNYFDGGLLSNDAQFFLFGGAVWKNDDLYETPDADDVLLYEAYQYGVDRPAWQQGFVPDSLGDDVTRYVAYGGAVNAPSENKAWYFSGMTAPNGENIAANPDTDGSNRAKNISQKMIQVDMASQVNPEWTTMDLPDGIEGRANPEVVWVPVGEQGILVVLGGVTHPQWESATEQSEDEDASEEESPKFMETIDVYDIANDEWYQQPTDGESPGARTRGCAVVAAASDYSSFNIYYYGGFDGLHATEDFYDDVWVLSLPSFKWTQLNEGTAIHARAGHKCFAPYPDQMMAFGGYPPSSGFNLACLDQGPLVIFNLTSGQWMESYHPDEHSDYGVPDRVVDAIGGNAAGGATATEPAGGWETDALGEVFSSSYNMSKISTWYPYDAATTDPGRPDLPEDSDDDDSGGGSGLPSWVGPVLGVVLGLMVVTGAIVLFCLWRKRKAIKGRRASEAETEDPGSRIWSWMKSHPTEKGTTVTTTEETTAPTSPEPTHYRAIDGAVSPASFPTEMQGTPVAELDATTPPAELSNDVSLSHKDVLQRYSRVGYGNTRQLSDHSGGFSYTNTTASVLRASASGDTDSVQGLDSPTTGVANYGGQNNDPPSVGLRGGANDAPMQSLSETMADGGGRSTPGEQGTQFPIETPISPPTRSEVNAEDYITARGDMVSPLGRPSVDSKLDFNRR